MDTPCFVIKNRALAKWEMIGGGVSCCYLSAT